MQIPEKVKIGGKIYKVERTDKLDMGNRYYSGEVDYLNLVIRICPNAKDKMEADFLHEMLHAIHAFLGYSRQDEKKIDELANTLHMVIQDNPEIFAEGEVN